MARRLVTHTRHRGGRVVLLCNPDEWWSPRTAIDAAVDIETGTHTYYIPSEPCRSARIMIDPETAHPVAVYDGIDLLAQLPRC